MYKVSINTDAYRQLRCSRKNWENGTTNDFMQAINGWNIRESSLKKVNWRINTFLHQACGDYGDTEFIEWKNNKKNKIQYRDVLCECDRIDDVAVYGFAQGYFKTDNAIEKLKKYGIVKIPFSVAYDCRQHIKNIDGCYMEILK